MKCILLADDEPNLRRLVHDTLEDPDFEIHEASNGEKALEMARRLHPDLLLLDWMMPLMTGIEVARQLRASARTASIPIVLLTAKGLERDRMIAAEVGVQGYLVKPFSPLELLAKVESLLKGP
jgi:two-component system phosphate regulon response regulator PhoB